MLRQITNQRGKLFSRSKATLAQRDRAIIWHPFSQEQTAPEPIAIKRASGSYLYDENGKKYLDLISSWWVNIHGHANPEIAAAIFKQASTLEHVIFAGYTHEPAVELCEGLAQILPSPLCRFFFSDNGSTAVEVALKMAYQYYWNIGQPERTLFLSFDGSYHGDTFGAMSVGRGSGYHEAYDKFLFSTLQIPYPHTFEGDLHVETKENQSLDELQRLLNENKDNVAALIVEPLVQGASGMRMCRKSFVENVVKICKGNGVFVIFDEVMTGFGRTGSKFALNQLQPDYSPDFLCISKGITGGFLPLSLTVTTQKIYNAFLADTFKFAFAHGHSYTANPVACAAAVKSLEILNRTSTLAAMESIQNAHKQGLEMLSEKCGDRVANTRNTGTISAFEVNGAYGYELNSTLKKRFAENGLLLRPLGNTLYTLPPYCITTEQLRKAYEIIANVIQNL